MPNKILFAVLAVILALVNWQILSKERILNDGQTMLLELAPRDPRSILQGDYMVLRYSIARAAASKSDALTEDGHLIVTLDDKQVARIARLETPGSQAGLAAGEHRLLYRKRNGQVKLATNAYFFEEGTGKAYRRARYGELRVSDDGQAVLVGLRDNEFNPIRP